MYLVLISIDKPEFWSQWHSGRTNRVYYTEFLSQEQVDDFVEDLRRMFPDSNLNVQGNKYKYHIKYTILNGGTLINDEDNLQSLLYICGTHHTWEDFLREKEKEKGKS